MTKIEWTDRTWNPITGCTKCSEGCKNCYAQAMTNRLRAMGLKKYENGFTVSLHEECMLEPLQWKKPCNLFVCSMSDIFHEDVPFGFVDKTLDVIHQTPYHRYQLLTKRAERMYEYFKTRSVPNNVWIGVTVECKRTAYRIDYLRKIPATIHFLSCEPLLESLGSIDLKGIEWIIVGGESGIQARPMKKDWVIELQNQIYKTGTAFFFKQWGTWGEDGIKRNKQVNGNLLDGKIIQHMPVVSNS